ncbi:hypothetical protein OG417_21365 [Actinoallomurus sp. NBC_01490]|uniref:DEAD/DEAH box helicase n=1 Tax=Actinoallomurus sp. NBC_01490 TaxID=2903557 RepID=UPI002E329D10|nr:DEAD/DEAH box helicase [Actinoallomurus sp. NBC_01490]
MAFKGGASAGAAAETPEAMYRDLPRRPDAVPGLLTHQADLLRLYASQHCDTPDLALELPTGTGKTIPALLIAEWVRRTRRVRAAYACPTDQLAWQVAQTAGREGIPAVVLTRSHADWPTDHEARYESADAVAITTYSTIFNSSPKLGPPTLLIFDDAHNGEQYVAEQYGVVVSRNGQPALYGDLLEALAPGLDGLLLQRLQAGDSSPGAHHQVKLVVPARHDAIPEALHQVLGRQGAPICFRYAMIRECLESCLAYVSPAAIQIRPMIPPTVDNELFARARQRLYLSATLGEGGELERAFGRPHIERLTLPASTPEPRSGTRYFVFPELVPDTDPAELARQIVARAGKALLLAPDTATAVTTARDLSQPSWKLMTIDDVGTSMTPFASANHAICALANRYDGLDLPGPACQVVVMEGVPDHDSLHERYLSQRVRAGFALADRIRTRVVQGAGRCTRGPNDSAVVVVYGAELTKYLVRPETLAPLSRDLQGEINFGRRNSGEDTTAVEVLDNVAVFLDHGEEWREGGEPLLAEMRREAVQVVPSGSTALAAAIADEIEASSLAGQGRWAEASRHAQAAAHKLSFGQEDTRGYRAFWLYLAGIWAYRAGRDGDLGQLSTARGLVRQAEQTSKPSVWVRQMPPLPDTETAALPTHDDIAVAAVVARMSGGIARGRHDAAVAKMLDGLAQTDPPLYEPELSQLGKLLGAEAAKPTGQARCDSTWCFDNALWIALEAKSDHQTTGLVSSKDVRAASGQLRILASDRHHDGVPPGSITVMISPKSAVDSTAAASVSTDDCLYLVHPETILHIAKDAKEAWDDVLASTTGRTTAELQDLVVAVFQRYGILPSHIRERLTDYQISG